MCQVLTLAVCLFAGHLTAHNHHGNHAQVPPVPGSDATHNVDKIHDFHDPTKDSNHIKEHYEGIANLDEANMTAEELEFHYFKQHDFDNDSRLDGLEILSALTHLMPSDIDERKEGETVEDLKAKQEETFQYYVDIIDTVLEEDDINNDGYMTYPEYVIARRRDEAREAKQEKEEKEKEANEKKENKGADL
ncbi:unnamed protein product [Owenia fusiformis]|uniref:EF-hand domain-containing protein n=1 Tax=Owenia fusiformis TaxID=6347 RepID=A0A8J1U2C0_OWEFU|nr:unnamed protein product [Owenia fusiformis]